MFESYIFQAKQVLLGSINTRKSFVYLDEILQNRGIETAYKRFFKAEADWWIYQENIRRRLIPYLNYEDTELQDLFQSQDALFIQKFRFDAETLRNIADSAIKTRINLLLRPRTTLKWFVYRGEPTKTFEEIFLRLNYLEDYNYLTEGFLNWIDSQNIPRKSDDILPLTEFVRSIEKIDNDWIIDLSPEEFTDFLNPIFSFFNFGEKVINSSAVPSEALIIFLNDKGIGYFSERLEKLALSGSLDSISKKYFLDFIYRTMDEFDASEQVKQATGEISLPVDEYPEFTIQDVTGIADEITDIAGMDEFDEIEKFDDFVLEYGNTEGDLFEISEIPEKNPDNNEIYLTGIIKEADEPENNELYDELQYLRNIIDENHNAFGTINETGCTDVPGDADNEREYGINTGIINIVKDSDYSLIPGFLTDSGEKFISFDDKISGQIFDNEFGKDNTKEK